MHSVQLIFFQALYFEGFWQDRENFERIGFKWKRVILAVQTAFFISNPDHKYAEKIRFESVQLSKFF